MTEEEARNAVTTLLRWVGEDPNRDGLQDTPRRVVTALREMTTPKHRVENLLSVTFEDRCDEVVIVRGIRFSSLCEHHLLPFSGVADVGYIPEHGRVVGLSKIPRAVVALAAGLQLQERLTRQIAEAIQEYVHPLGVGVVLRAVHQCVACRGARQPDAEMVTSTVLGVFRENPGTRAEFMMLLDGGRHG